MTTIPSIAERTIACRRVPIFDFDKNIISPKTIRLDARGYDRIVTW